MRKASKGMGRIDGGDIYEESAVCSLCGNSVGFNIGVGKRRQ